MKIEHVVPVVVSCRKMHEHWWDTMYMTYDDAAPLEITMELRNRAPHDDPTGTHPDPVWRLPRIEFADAITYDVPGVISHVGLATLKIRMSKPSIMVVMVPYDGVDTYFMFKIAKLRLFMDDVQNCVPQSCIDVALDVDRLIGRLLYS